jgi:hypothetical protein
MKWSLSQCLASERIMSSLSLCIHPLSEKKDAFQVCFDFSRTSVKVLSICDAKNRYLYLEIFVPVSSKINYTK